MTTTTGEREWLLYRFWDRDGRLLYIGQTGRMALVRWLEHIQTQWWADQIFTMQADTVTYPSLAAVLAAEKHAIETEWPLHNVEHNHGNPHRVRRPANVPNPTRTAAPQRRPSVPRRRWTRRQRRTALLAAVWLVLAAGIWAVVGSRVSAGHGVELGAVVATGVLVGACRTRPRRRRR